MLDKKHLTRVLCVFDIHELLNRTIPELRERPTACLCCTISISILFLDGYKKVNNKIHIKT